MERARKDRDDTNKKCGELKRQVEQATREKEATDKLVRDLRAQTVKLRESLREQGSHAVREQAHKDGVDRLTAEKSELVEQLEQRDRAIESERRIHLAATLEHQQAMDQLKQQLEETADKLNELRQRKSVKLSTHDVIRIKAILRPGVHEYMWNDNVIMGTTPTTEVNRQLFQRSAINFQNSVIALIKDWCDPPVAGQEAPAPEHLNVSEMYHQLLDLRSRQLRYTRASCGTIQADLLGNILTRARPTSRAMLEVDDVQHQGTCLEFEREPVNIDHAGNVQVQSVAAQQQCAVALSLIHISEPTRPY